MRKYYFGLFTAFILIFNQFTVVSAQSQSNARTSSDTVMVLPFENTSNLNAYNWVGESFAEGLTDLFAKLGTNGAGVRVVANDERKIVQQKLRLPLTALPSLATSIKLAQQSKASLLVLGKYSVTPQQGDVATTLRVTVRTVRVQDGTFVGETLRDGRTVLREVDLADAISKLQTLQGQVAHQILYQREGNSLSLSQNEVVEISKRVPPRAFEAYVKGMLTAPADELRANFFKNAVRFYAEEKAGETYAQAALELGHFYLRQNNFQAAEESFAKIPRGTPVYAEAAFYAGLMQWNLNNRELARDTFRQLAEATGLTAAYNNLGAVQLQTIASEKDLTARNELIEESLKQLETAQKSAPEDAVVRYNYGYALFLARRYKDAAQVLRDVLTNDSRDGQAQFLLAKSLERTGETAAAVEPDNQARLFLQTDNLYAKAQTEWQKSGTTGVIPFRLYKDFNRSDWGKTDSNDKPLPANSDNELQARLQTARNLYQKGSDDEALAELRQILVRDSMNAETYLLIGNIHLRRGDLEAAVSNLKTAVFWKNDLIEGHIALGKIFLERGDYIQATTYAQSALRLDANNQEAVALARQVERKAK